MANRSLEENIALLLKALREAGDDGLTIDQAKTVLFGDDLHSKSPTKKLLEQLKAKGYVRAKVDKMDVYYVLLPRR